MLYGPPPDPHQILAATGPLEEPLAWLLCFLFGGALVVLAARWRVHRALRALSACIGLTVLLTAPLAGLLGRFVYGAWPTIDKAGSYLFYVHGAQWEILTHPFTSPMLKLIGVHVGHLWLVAFFDLFLGTHGAFNMLALLLPALGWWAAFLLFEETGAKPAWAFTLAFPFGMGLHVFRDLNWATIEKAAVFGIPLFLWSLLRAWRRGGSWHLGAALLFLFTAWLNLYVGIVNAAAAAIFLAGTRDRRALVTVLSSALASLPLVLLQILLLRGSGALSEPERFLRERAALDVVSLWPPTWIRLEAWRALNLFGLGAGFWGLWRLRRRRLGLAAGVGALLLFLLALGPTISGTIESGIPNPLYLALWHFLPGFWRIAKPESFFEGSYLVLLGAGALYLSRLEKLPRWPSLPGRLFGAPPEKRLPRLVLLVFLAFWLVSVRTHPAFPAFTEPVEVSLSKTWQQGVFGDEAP